VEKHVWDAIEPLQGSPELPGLQSIPIKHEKQLKTMKQNETQVQQIQ